MNSEKCYIMCWVGLRKGRKREGGGYYLLPVNYFASGVRHIYSRQNPPKGVRTYGNGVVILYNIKSIIMWNFEMAQPSFALAAFLAIYEVRPELQCFIIKQVSRDSASFACIICGRKLITSLGCRHRQQK